jgi:parvulin-like peptidyl-prolyl isomerase
VSDPVRTLYGYAVYQVDAKKPQRALAYDDVNTARLTEELRRAETDRVRSVWLTALRQRATVEVRSAP